MSTINSTVRCLTRMDHVSILSVLTSFEKGSNNDKIIEESVNKALSLLSEDDKRSIEKLWEDWDEDQDIRWRYILLIIFVIKGTMKTSLNDKNDTFSVKELQTLKIAVEIITLQGIKANCILYGKLSDDPKDMAQKFERLAYVAKFCSTCFDDFLLKTCVLTHVGPILTSLMFITNAVITPPKLYHTPPNNKQDSAMTPKLYEKLTNAQKEFKTILYQTMAKCPLTILMKELMVIHGTGRYPKFMKVPAKMYLLECLVKPNGVLSLILMMCNEEEFSNISKHWDKLETASRLLASSCGNEDKYYDSICGQLIELLKTHKFNQITTIVNVCIKSLYEYNANICMDKFMKVIAAPFFYAENKTEVEGKLWDEQEVTNSIEMLSKCFLTDELEFKQLPTEMLIPITVPIWHIYVKSISSISSYRHKIKQLTLKILSSTDNQDELFSLFLNYSQKFSRNYGAKLNYQLGNSGNFEIVKKGNDIDQDEFCKALFELVKEDEIVAFKLFNFLLKRLLSFETDAENRLETSWDIVDRITKHLSSVNLLVELANLSIVQKNNLEKPENLLSFVTSLLTKQLDSNRMTSQDDEMDVGYIGLMLVKQILEENQDCTNWTPFEEFVSFLVGKNISSSAKKLVDEIVHVVKVKKKSKNKNYEDLSSSQEKSEFDKAREDLADPMLPVRAHGLIALTKLIEKGDNETLEKKEFLVCIFQLNLKHEDSFIYLAAINGLCALTLRYPQSVIEILIQEFINMPQRAVQHELSPENRVKIGEILVKATRSLGEMASAHRTALINGFLCAVRDSDSMVRASSLSCLGELCKILGFRLGSVVDEVIYCIYCIIKHDKQPECRRAAVLVITLLLRGLGKDVLVGLDPKHLLETYRYLKYLRDNDKDDVIRLHVQLALEEIDDIVTNQLLSKPKLEKKIFLISE